jgi:hypothetical protein
MYSRTGKRVDHWSLVIELHVEDHKQGRINSRYLRRPYLRREKELGCEVYVKSASPTDLEIGIAVCLDKNLFSTSTQD